MDASKTSSQRSMDASKTSNYNAQANSLASRSNKFVMIRLRRRTTILEQQR